VRRNSSVSDADLYLLRGAMDDDEKAVQCPRCGQLPTVSGDDKIGWRMFCTAHTLRFETWGETFTEAEDAWIRYCARERYKIEEKESNSAA